MVPEPSAEILGSRCGFAPAESFGVDRPCAQWFAAPVFPVLPGTSKPGFVGWRLNENGKETESLRIGGPTLELESQHRIWYPRNHGRPFGFPRRSNQPKNGGEHLSKMGNTNKNGAPLGEKRPTPSGPKLPRPFKKKKEENQKTRFGLLRGFELLMALDGQDRHGLESKRVS